MFYITLILQNYMMQDDGTLWYIPFFLMWAYMFCQWSYGGLIIFESIRLYTKLNVKFLAFSIRSSKNHIHEICQMLVSSCFGWYLGPMISWASKNGCFDCWLDWAWLTTTLLGCFTSQSVQKIWIPQHKYTYTLLVEWIIKEWKIRYKASRMTEILLNRVRLCLIILSIWVHLVLLC